MEEQSTCRIGKEHLSRMAGNLSYELFGAATS